MIYHNYHKTILIVIDKIAFLLYNMQQSQGVGIIMSNFEEERNNYFLKCHDNKMIFETITRRCGINNYSDDFNNHIIIAILAILNCPRNELELKFANSIVDFEHDIKEIGNAIGENRLPTQGLEESIELGVFSNFLKKAVPLIYAQDAPVFKKIAEELGYTGVDNIDYQNLAQYALNILLTFAGIDKNPIIACFTEAILKNLNFSYSQEKLTDFLIFISVPYLVIVIDNLGKIDNLDNYSSENFELTENKVKFVSSFEDSFHEVCERLINENKKNSR